MNETSFPGDSLLPFPEGTAGALLDGRGRISGCSPEAGALLGRSAADAVGRPAHELLADPSAWPTLVAAYTRGEAGGETVLRGGGGEDVPVVYQAFALAADDEGEGGESAGGTGGGCLVLAVPTPVAARWHQDRAFVRELFLQDRVGLAVFDAELRLLRTNTHLLPYTGVPRNLQGRRLSEFLWPGDAASIEKKLREVLRTGRPSVGTEEILRTVEDPAGGVVISISAFRLQAPDGQVLGVTGLFTDVTELRRSGERLALLHRATANVGGSLSVRDTGRELADALVPGLGDLAVVEIADAVMLGEEPVPDREGRLRLRRTAVAGQPAAGAGATRAGTALVAVDAVDTVNAVDTVDSAGAGAGAGGVGGYPTFMTAPLRARGMVLGRVSLGRHPDRGAYEDADRDLLREIAGRAALALDNARRFTRERRAALGLQRSMLPPTQSETTAASTSGVYLPADTTTGVGGDWFDVIPLSSARVALVVGDVVGHGLAATATMGRLRTAVRTLADLDLEPDELLAHLDDLVTQLFAEPEESDGGSEPDGRDPGDTDGDGDSDGDTDDDRDEGWHIGHPSSPTGATCVFAIYDPVSLRCSVASAGHPPPAVADPEGRVSYLPVDPGPPLGVGGLPFETTEVELAPGSVLALYSDGLIEGQDGDLDAGMADLAARLGRPGALARPLRELGREIATARRGDGGGHQGASDGHGPGENQSRGQGQGQGEGLGDDVTLLLARTRAVPAEDAVSWPIEADPAAVGTVREAATAQLRAWGLEELVFTTELVLSELVTNAIRYAGGPIEVRIVRAGRLICEVSDPSATHPRMRRARLTDEGGRGLYLVAQLATRWGSRYSRAGKTIWAEQDFPPPVATE
ncbi:MULTISPECIES: SpoIIE family protein phosphatase [unclassified Streptomyces]|uniref:SpoIIE family protein phosphatase n=1 Tax=Streptomyces sp. NPDC127129 TaxID=3345373 RepID=UPI003642C2CA